jgi:hypothetical protein
MQDAPLMLSGRGDPAPNRGAASVCGQLRVRQRFGLARTKASIWTPSG